MVKASKKTHLAKKENFTPGTWWSNPLIVSTIIAVIAFIVYSNSLSNGFVLDDTLVITKNSFTTQGIKGINDIFSHDTFEGFYGASSEEIKVAGGRYRPLSLAFFAVIYQVFEANAFVFHLWNVLLFSICCAILYYVLRYVFDPVTGVSTAVFAGLTALLFAVHPVHTEVVNNIKSNDEILCLILSLISLFLAIKYMDTKRKSLGYWSGVMFFFACLAKENAAVFLVIIPFTWYFRSQFTKKKFISLMPLMISLGAGFILYFIIRYSILGWSLGETSLDLINNPFIKFTGENWEHVTFSEKLGMIFLALGKYLLLLVFPVSLSTDYYPRYIDVTTLGNPFALLSLFAYLAMAVYAIVKIWKKQFRVDVYGIVFFLVSLSIVSNLLFPIGTNLAERFLFTPSVGFLIAVSGLVLPLLFTQKQKFPLIPALVVSIVLLLLAGRTFVRNFDFESNLKLMSKDIIVSEKSAKIQNALGALIAEEALHSKDHATKMKLSQEAMIHLNKALEIHPTYLEAFYMRGNVNFMLGNYEEAILDYMRTIQMNENYKAVYPNYALALREGAREAIENQGDIRQAIYYLEESLKLYPDEQETKLLMEKAKSLIQNK
jgi:protein O-mannosyl-transferase